MNIISLPTEGREYHLLIVDDNKFDRELYRKLLQRPTGSCNFLQAASGAEGLAMLQTDKVDCVLLDFKLPDMTGLEFLTAAASDGELPCAMILVTGQGSEVIAVEAMKRGVQDYLMKDRINASNLWRAMITAVTQTELRQRLAGSLRDVTAANKALEQEAAIRKATECELRAATDIAEQANRAKTRFVAMVTHELRTPLNGILGYAQLLHIEGGLSPLQESRVSAMTQAGQHLLGMIERVLDFASVEAGRMELRLVPVSVRDLSEGCVSFIAPIAAEHALSLRMVSSFDAPLQISADPARLRQVLLNLLGNAVKFTDTGGVELRVLAGATPGGLRLEVADTGCGIDDASRARLFKDFERLGASTSVEGAGLGLAIAARIVGLMNGTIIHIANPGGGSVFRVDLPAGEWAPALLPEIKSAVPSQPGRRVLLVDDIAMNRDVIGSFLRAADHAVLIADSGYAAVQLASEQSFDLILMDVRMPGMDGLEATRRIRVLPGPPGRVPILAMTANTFPDQVAQCLAAGMDGHVGKPVDYATLVRAIDDAVAHRPTHRTVDAIAGSCPNATRRDGLDSALLEQTLGFLAPEDIVDNLRALRQQMEETLSLLHQAANRERLAEVAHTLASSAGMFGFTTLSALLRDFEHAAMTDHVKSEQIGCTVETETRRALAALDELQRERQESPI